MHKYVVVFLVVLVGLKLAHAVDNECPGGYYGVQLENGEIKCKDCNLRVKCPMGMGVSTYIKCGSVVPVSTNAHCVDCVKGKTYSETHNGMLCQPCLSCHKNEAVEKKCIVTKDDTVCKGVCAKGFYPKNNSIKYCTPCSKCHPKKILLNKKCKDDDMPTDMQCEHVEFTPTAQTTKIESDSTLNKTNHPNNESTEYGQDLACLIYKCGFYTCLVVLLILLVKVFFSCWKKRSKKSTAVELSPESMPLTGDVECRASDKVANVEVAHVATETDEIPELYQLSRPSTLRKRSVSGGSDRRVSFSAQNPIAEHIIPEEVTTINKKIEDKQTSRPENERKKRTLSTGSGSGFSKIFGRQNSNPGSEHKQESIAGKIKRNNTFSNFGRNPKGTKEETQGMLSFSDSNDDDDDDVSSQTTNFALEEKPKTPKNNDDNDEKDLLSFEVPRKSEERPPIEPTNKRVSDLNAETHRRVCALLDVENDGKDWRTLAGKMDYTNEDVKFFTGKSQQLLSNWGTKSGNHLPKLKKILSEMGRDDVITLLNEKIV